MLELLMGFLVLAVVGTLALRWLHRYGVHRWGWTVSLGTLWVWCSIGVLVALVGVFVYLFNTAEFPT